MFALLIPTRNRVTSLGHVLRFLEKFYPGTRVVVADGSTGDYQPAVEALCQGVSRLEMDYRKYDSSIDLFDRIIHVLSHLEDEFVVMGADDDYPLIDRLKICEKYLANNPDYVLSQGSYVVMTYTPGEPYQARVTIAHPLRNDSPLNRMKRFSAWHYQTSYSMARRSYLLARYQKLKPIFTSTFFDFTAGLHDCLAGKIHSVKMATYFATTNGVHAHPRPSDNLAFLRNADTMLQMVAALARDIVDKAGLDIEAAEKLAQRTYLRRLAFRFVPLPDLGAARQRLQRAAFGQNPFETPTIHAQVQEFQQMMHPSNPVRDAFEDKLFYIRDAQLELAEHFGNRIAKDVDHL